MVKAPKSDTFFGAESAIFVKFGDFSKKLTLKQNIISVENVFLAVEALR